MPAIAAVSDPSAVARWEHFPHDADIGVRGYGATPGEACEQAALAMMATILDPATVRLDEAVEVAVEAPRLDLLLVDWLNALIYEMAERRMVFGAFDVKIENNRLEAGLSARACRVFDMRQPSKRRARPTQNLLSSRIGQDYGGRNA